MTLACTWDHVHIRTPDVEATAQWFADKLDAEIVRAPGRVDIRLGGAMIFLAPVTPEMGVGPSPVQPHLGLDHFGLKVKDIDAVAADLKARGVEFTKEPHTLKPGLRIAFIRAPQGVSIEILERDPKYT
ncbi:VOC family protein [Tardiphaga alba]|uniref:VOC family protein n=1 Tax=Tardiphaga alba TaxID=340268 RepID=A0ABX8AFW3_9BRAD|nr:VOC family protein [Tardiphaga alba]QUS41275.1 VOC family protein [Tardiphaga alba]